MRVKSWTVWSFNSWHGRVSTHWHLWVSRGSRRKHGLLCFFCHLSPPLPTCAVFLLFFLPLLAFYGILRAATLECIVATKAISSSGLRRTSDGGWSSKAAAWNCVPNQSLSQSACHLSSVCGYSCSLISQKQHLKLYFPHYFVACLFFPAVCLSIHSKQRECSCSAEGPIWNSAAELLLSFSMEKALQTSLVVNARHMQEQHF